MTFLAVKSPLKRTQAVMNPVMLAIRR